MNLFKYEKVVDFTLVNCEKAKLVQLKSSQREGATPSLKTFIRFNFQRCFQQANHVQKTCTNCLKCICKVLTNMKTIGLNFELALKYCSYICCNLWAKLYIFLKHAEPNLGPTPSQLFPSYMCDTGCLVIVLSNFVSCVF